MIWKERDEFWRFVESSPMNAIDYKNWCYFKITEIEVRKKIPGIQPITDLSGEDDPPGPVSRWYAVIDNVPVLFDLHNSIPEGPGVMIYHGFGLDARTKVRQMFKRWGKEWEESQIA